MYFLRRIWDIRDTIIDPHIPALQTNSRKDLGMLLDDKLNCNEQISKVLCNNIIGVTRKLPRPTLHGVFESFIWATFYLWTLNLQPPVKQRFIQK